MNKKIDIEELRVFMQDMSPETKVYLGCDSERFRNKGVWYADYILSVVIHKNGRNGCKVFGEIQTERDHDQRKDRPFNRMMTEAQKVAELYLRLKEVFYDFEVEVHLDIAQTKENGSNCAAQAAIGYIRAMCNVTPILKSKEGFGGGPSFAASFAADRARELGIVS